MALKNAANNFFSLVLGTKMGMKRRYQGRIGKVDEVLIVGMGMGRVWSESSQIWTRTFLFFIDPDSNPNHKGLKFSYLNLDLNPLDLMG